MGGKGSGRKASAKHEKCKHCLYDNSVLCPILDKIQHGDCVDCMWLPDEKYEEVFDLAEKEKRIPICPYNEGIECEWAKTPDSFMNRPVRGHCIFCSWCPEEEQHANSCHFGEWVKSKLGILGMGRTLWPMETGKEIKNGN